MTEYWKENPDGFINIHNECRYIDLHPFIAKFISAHKLSKILDFGCGDGYQMKLLNWGNIQYAGLYDITDIMLETAKVNINNPKAHFFNDITKCNFKFDCVIINLVLMTISTIEEQESLLNTIKSYMFKDAKLIIGLTHPCFRSYKFSTFHTEYAEDREYDYFDEGTSFKVFMQDGINQNKTRQNSTITIGHYQHQ